MHGNAYVLVPTKSSKTSEEARQYVKSYLEKNHFCSPSGRWDHNPVDYFVIGGRWSGKLTEAHVDEKKIKKFWAACRRKGIGRTMSNKCSQQKEAEAIFLKIFSDFDLNTMPCLFFRDSYERKGFSDDAMIVDEIIWAKIIEPGLEADLMDGGAVIHTQTNNKYETKLDKNDVIGKCWCVVIDFHC
ncbi:MAG: hypothetical protein KCHDKBKB_02888 [Elusimicrobia bacterium]|nr:hypothetical protein [Elusimicrobiota bacterium]